MLLLFVAGAAEANGYISKGESCKGDCDPTKATLQYVGWTDYESLCDAAPVGMIEVIGRADPLQFEFAETEKFFKKLDDAFGQIGVGAGESAALAAEARQGFGKLGEDVLPGLKAYDCAASGVSRMERVEKVKAALEKIRGSESFLKDFLKRAKPVAANSDAWLYGILIPAHQLSCRLYFAKTTIDFTMSHGMNPALAKTCETARAVEETRPPTPGIEGSESSDSDITGI